MTRGKENTLQEGKSLFVVQLSPAPSKAFVVLESVLSYKV